MDDVGPGGCVGDYVPWYFGPRSPMMFTLSRNNYEYQDGFDEVLYLVSSVPTIVALGAAWIASDRNAALNLAEFTDDEDSLPDHISWDVITARYWTDYPDGADLRAAEFLVQRIRRLGGRGGYRDEDRGDTRAGRSHPRRA